MRIRDVAALCLAFAATACAAADTDEDHGSAHGAVVDISRTPAKTQAVGNCWLYTTTGLVESLHKEATGATWDVSENYLTYWMMYERIMAKSCANDLLTDGSFATGGWLDGGRELIARRGIMLEDDFGRDDDGAIVNGAIETISSELSSSEALRAAVQRHDGTAVRAALDRAFALPPELSAGLDAQFGADGQSRAECVGNCAPVHFDDQIAARIAGESMTLHDALASYVHVPMPTADDPAQFRSWEKAIQRALHARAAVPLAWIANADEAAGDGRFDRDDNAFPDITEAFDAHRAGGHASLVVDYGAKDVPGFGTLPVGQVASADAMTSALSDQTEITELRIKNSWGDSPVATTSHFGETGYTDLGRGLLRGISQLCQDAVEPTTTPVNDTNAAPPACLPPAEKRSDAEPTATGPGGDPLPTPKTCGYILSVMDVMVPRQFLTPGAPAAPVQDERRGNAR